MAMIPTGKKIYLCTPDLKPVTQLNGVDTESVSYTEHLRDFSSLSFTVDEYIVIDGRQVKSNGYDELDVYMYLYLEDIAFFQMQYPSVNNDGQKESKSITAYSIDKEWEDKDWVNFKCNTGEKDSLEQLVPDNTDDLGFTISFIKFYDPTRKDLSLLHIILEKMPSWSIDDADIDSELWDLKLSFSEDSTNLYALLTSVIAPRAECVFMFDCLNRKLKAHHKDNLDFDTDIFIGFRNLSSQIDQTVNEDSVFTRFNVAGGNDLTINDWNYNNGRIVNIDYFMREPYMTAAQVDKFRAWFDWQDEHREEFAGYSQTVSDMESQIYTLKYLLPDDGTEIQQWKEMSMEGLEESLKYYQALLAAFEVSVDTNVTYEGSDGKTYHIRETVDENGIVTRDVVDENDVIIQPEVTISYVPRTNGQGEIDYDYYYQLLRNMDNGKSGYYTYYEIVNYILPNIVIAIYNKDVQTEDDKLDYVEEFETNWELYGSVELGGKLDAYNERLKTLNAYANPHGYLIVDEVLDGVTYVEDTLELVDINIVTSSHNYTYEDILEIDDVRGVAFKETDDGLFLVISVNNDPVFNESVTRIDYEYKYKETEEDEEYTVVEESLTNVRLDFVEEYSVGDQYERLHNEYLEVIGYIGDENTEDTILWWIKQREDEIEEIGTEERVYNMLRMEMMAKVNMYNTEIIESDENEYGYDLIELDTINSEWGFTQEDIDLYHILLHDTDYINENILITSLNTTSTLTSYETIIQKEKELIIDAKKKLSEVSQPQITFSVNMDNIMQIKEFENLRNDCSLLKFIRLGIRDDYSVKLRIVGRSWNPCEVSEDFTLEFSNMINSSSGRSDLTDLLNNANGVSKNAITLGTGNSDSDKEYAANLLSLMLGTGIFARAVRVVGVGVNVSQVNDLISDYLFENVINEAAFNRIFANYIDVDTLVANSIRAATISADQIVDGAGKTVVDLVNSAININTITANQAFINSVQSISSTTVSQVANDAYIYNAVAGKISVADLRAGDIVISNQARILSDNGAMVMNGNALQIFGEDSNGDPYVGIQLGYDATSNPSLIVRNEDGATILTPSGITSDAIADGLIINDMVSDGTLTRDKLSFRIVDTDEDGNISIVNVKDGTGGSFGVEYTNFKNTTSSTLSSLNTNITTINNNITTLDNKIDNSATYTLQIVAPNGTNMRGGNITLTAKLFRNSEEITDDYGAQYFTWTRHSKDSYGDEYWNQNHSTGTKTLLLTGNDVIISADFQCTFEYGTVTVTSG